MKLHDLSKIFLTVVAIDQNSQKIVSRIDTAPSFLLWRIELENDVKMTSKRRSNKINLLSLSFVSKCMSKAFLIDIH